MTLQNKVLLINTGLLAAVTFFFAWTTDTFPGNGFFLMLGVIAFAGAAAALGLGLLLLLRADKRPARGFIWSGLLFGVLGAVAFFLLRSY